MKVEQEGTGFAPITIILGTKEEADIMWAALNAPTGDVVRYSNNHLKVDKISTLFHQMFCDFDEVHTTVWY